MYKNKYCAIIFYFLFTFNSVLLSANGEILFEDNFDSSPEWQSKQTVHKSIPGGFDIGWSYTRSDKCTTYCPPKGWTSYRAPSSLFTDHPGKDTYIINKDGARGGAGQGLTYNIESVGTPGETWGEWTGGSLDVWLGEKGYKEIYVRYFVRFSDTWKWTRNDKTAHCLWKMGRISTFNDNIWTSSTSPHVYFSSGLNYPLGSTEAYYNAGTDKKIFVTAIRKAPDYDASEGPDNHISTNIPENGEWHCYEFYRKMNSAPGIADGGYAFWIDGVEQVRRNDVMWKKVGSNTTHNWNWIMLFDNINNSAYTLADHMELTLYIDDIVISTKYIGPNYVIPKINLNFPTFPK